MGSSLEGLLMKMKNNPKGVNFADLVKVCNYFFGEPRQKGTSNHVYRTPWLGDPRVNIQNSKGKAKAYQVKQALQAVDKLKGEQHV